MRKLLPVLLVLFVGGCADDPIIDTRGVDEQKYQQDLSECRDYAEGVNTGKEVLKRGAIGAAVGGAIGAIVGDHNIAGQIAGAGAVSGGARGAERAEQRKEQVVFNCLRGRGYKVLG